MVVERIIEHDGAEGLVAFRFDAEALGEIVEGLLDMADSFSGYPGLAPKMGSLLGLSESLCEGLDLETSNEKMDRARAIREGLDP